MILLTVNKTTYKCTKCKTEGQIKNGYFSIDNGICPKCFQENYQIIKKMANKNKNIKINNN